MYMYSNRAKNPLNQINTLAESEEDNTDECGWSEGQRLANSQWTGDWELGTGSGDWDAGGQRAAWQIMLKGIIVNIRGKCCNLNL